MPNPALIAHNQQFKKEIVALAPGVWTAVGFAASNVHLIEGEHSLTIVDTTESTRAAENILAEFRKLSDKPVGRIIYTHAHRDHISGASVFSDGTVPILAGHLFKSDLVDLNPSRIAPDKALGRRTLAQFGIGLSDAERINIGCGPGDRPIEGLGAGFLAPTDLIETDCSVDLDGVAARLILAPGETADHMVVWLPELQILICGDNWYHSFPNLYAIRGTPYRDFDAWAETLTELAKLKPAVLAPGHTRPVLGHDNIQEVLSTTRDAILHVIRFTAEGMDQGRSLDDIAATITLPPELADKPWLQEFYGKLSWSARAYAGGTLGWYGGNPTELGTMASLKRAEAMAALAGGVDALHAAAVASTDLQWQLELYDHLSALGEDMRVLKACAMEALADVEINATARNTYLWEARKLRAER